MAGQMYTVKRLQTTQICGQDFELATRQNRIGTRRQSFLELEAFL